MAKAAPQLHPKSTTLNRRRLIAGAAMAIAASAAPAAASPLDSFVFAPTADGRAIMALIAEQRAIDTHGDDPEGEKLTELYGQIDDIARRIVARPLRSPSDLVDRAIAAAWGCQPFDGGLISDDPAGVQTALVVGVLGLAGIAPALCNASMA